MFWINELFYREPVIVFKRKVHPETTLEISSKSDVKWESYDILKFRLFFTKQIYAQLSDMQMRESMMSLTHYFFCFLLFELYNISIFTDLTIRTLLVEPQNVKTMVIPHVQEGIKLCFSWQWGENWNISYFI